MNREHRVALPAYCGTGKPGIIGDMEGLTEKQRRFVEEFPVDFNLAAAYRRAGYTVKNDNVAHREGHRLLRNPKIAAAIDARRAALSAAAEASAKDAITELSLIA